LPSLRNWIRKKIQMEPIKDGRESVANKSPLHSSISTLFIVVCIAAFLGVLYLYYLNNTRRDVFAPHIDEYFQSAYQEAGRAIFHKGDVVFLDGDYRKLHTLSHEPPLPDIAASSPQAVKTIVLVTTKHNKIGAYPGLIIQGEDVGKEDSLSLAFKSQGNTLHAFRGDSEITIVDKETGALIAKEVLRGKDPPDIIVDITKRHNLYFVTAGKESKAQIGSVVWTKDTECGIVGSLPNNDDIVATVKNYMQTK
jgi:hypothetical protein